MQIRSFLKGSVPFSIALLLGVAAALFLTEPGVPDANSVPVVKAVKGPERIYSPVRPQGPGISEGKPGEMPEIKPAAPGCPGTCNVKILSKPRASYTDAARTNNTQGNVVLRITFLASGQIGSISPISGLPYGLTEQAIAAAREIKFTPATKDGIPYTKQMTVQYGFTIY